MPKNFHTVTPYYTVPDLPAFLDFVTRAFGAEITFREPNNRHAEARIGDSMIMAGQARDEWKPNKMSAYLYIDDVDAWYRRALDAGAASQSEPADQAYGDRTAGVTDPWGNNWWFGKPLDE